MKKHDLYHESQDFVNLMMRGITKRRIGFLGGTFDPVHFGHLNLALRILEEYGLDQVLFCPTPLSPHKEMIAPQASIEHRCAMVACAIAPLSQFALCSFEIEQKKPCYTVDTIRALKAEQPDAQFHLVLGEDSLQRLAEWKEVEILLSLAPPLIGSRCASFECSPLETCFKKEFITIPLMDISSTEIRNRLRKGLYCGHLLPANVLDYICSNKLYSMS